MAKTFEIDFGDDKEVPRGTFEVDFPEEQPKPAFESLLPPTGRPLAGAVEAGLGIGSAGLGAITGGLVGLSNLPFRGLDYARAQARAYQDALTYEPRSEGGRAAVSLASIVPTWLSEQAQKISDWSYEHSPKAIAPAVGAATQAGLEFIPQILAKGAKAPVASRLETKALERGGQFRQSTVERGTMEAARKEGFSVDPMIRENTRMERNQAAANRVARREAGLGENDPISIDSLNEVRDRAAAPYREVAKLSTDAKFALDQLKEARFWANKHHRAADRAPGGSPQDLKEAMRLDEEAKSWERVIDEEAVKAGRKDLLPKLREARIAIAKTYDVQRALNVGNGNIDAAVLGRMLDKGAPLTGGLETIARFEQSTRGAFPSGGVAVEQGGMPRIPLSKFALAMSAVNAASRLKGPKSYKEPLSLSDIATRQPSIYMLGPPLAEEPQPNPWERYAK